MKTTLASGLVLLLACGACGGRARATAPNRHFAVRLLFVGGPGSGSQSRAQGYLGVDVRDVTGDQVAVLKLKDTHGAEITLVDHDAPAGKAGLREHDVVLQMNGQAVEGEEQIRRMLREQTPGRTVVLLISRDGQLITVKAQMANREELERQAWQQHLTVPEPVGELPPPPDSAAGAQSQQSPQPPPLHGGNSFMGRMLLMSPSYTGAMLEMMSSQLAEFFGAPGGTGLLVRSVEANSPAALAGMHAGDVVIRANAQPVGSTSDWSRAIQNSRGRPVTVVVLRDRKEQTLTLTPDGKKRSWLDFFSPFGNHAAFQSAACRLC
jgi:membrane-associated protease RseP (regulator of RpoE activity)